MAAAWPEHEVRIIAFTAAWQGSTQQALCHKSNVLCLALHALQLRR